MRLFIKLIRLIFVAMFGFFIGLGVSTGFSIDTFIGMIICVIAWCIYTHLLHTQYRPKPTISIHNLADGKPAGIPDEVWNELQHIITESDCPDKLEPEKENEDKWN